MNALDVLYCGLAVATTPWWARKSRAGWAERFGRTARIQADGPKILLHAVSVGEVSALRHLVPSLAARAHVVVSAGTDTGLRQARELFSGSCDIVRYPLDFSWSVRRFLDAVRPDAVGLVELELWPNFVRECAQRKIPVGIINGRLSERSYKGYRKIRRLLGRTVRSLAFVAAQDEDYALRFRGLGVPQDRIRITGSMKWDAARIEDRVAGAEKLRMDMGISTGFPLVVAGSTGPGEEALLHTACPPGAQLLCAPRKPERFDEAAAAMPGCVRRTQPGQGDPGRGRFLLDTIGELRAAYSLADVVVVGRSFGNLYGSDPIEPIALGKATVIGPAYTDFREIVRCFERADGLVISSRDRLSRDLVRLVGDPGERDRLGAAGRECIRAHQGASRAHEELLLDLVRKGERDPDRAPCSALGGAA